MKTTYIYHHLGLGDHIICNGLVRKLIKLYQIDEPHIAVTPQNLESVKFMYRDINGVKYLSGQYHQIDNFISKNNLTHPSLLKIGFDHLRSLQKDPNNVLTWDEIFYKQYEIDFNIRWEGFKFNRDKERENNLYNILNPDNQEYILIHKNGSSGGDRIVYESLRTDIKRIFVEPITPIIFDYCKLIENAKEIHAVDSCFHLLADSISTNSKLFHHDLKYCRNPEEPHRTKNNWIKI